MDRELLNEMRGIMAGLSGSAASSTAQELSARTGLSLRRIYSLTADVRNSSRTRRSDHGISKTELPAASQDALVKLVHDLGFDAELAIQTALGSGLIAAEDAPSPSTLRRWARNMGLKRGAGSSGDGKVCRRWEAARPNALHQCDSTVSATFYLDDAGAVGHESAKDVNRNRPGNKKPRLILYVLVDDYSRITFARYYLAENTLNWCDFLWHAWGPKTDPGKCPFYGVPDILYTDNGSCMNSARFRSAMMALGVDLKFHAAYHPQSKGKVERAIGVVQQKLEKLYLLQKPSTLGQANEVMEAFLVGHNNRLHSVTGERPFARWQSGIESVRTLPADAILKALTMRRETRVLNAHLEFTLAGNRFAVPYIEPFKSMPVGQKIDIEYCPECPFEVNVVTWTASYACTYIAKGAEYQVRNLPSQAEATTTTSTTEQRLAGVDLSGLRPLDRLAPAAAESPKTNRLPVEVPIEANYKPHPLTVAQARRGDDPGQDGMHVIQIPEHQLSEVELIRRLQDANIIEMPPTPADRDRIARILRGATTIGENELTKRLEATPDRSPEPDEVKNRGGVQIG